MGEVDLMVREVVLTALKESKKLEKKGKLEESLSKLERVASEAENLLLPFSWKITERIAFLCNKISETVNQKTKYLRRAEQIMKNWITLCKKYKLHIHELIFRQYLHTLNNWAEVHQKLTNYHMALSYLMKAVRFIDTSYIEELESLEIAASTMLNNSEGPNKLENLQNLLENRIPQKLFMVHENRIGIYIKAYLNIGQASRSVADKETMNTAFNITKEISNFYLNKSHWLYELVNSIIKKTKEFHPALFESKPKPKKTETLFGKESLFQINVNNLETSQEALQLPLKESTSLISPIATSRTVKIPGRYYNKTQLETVQKKLDEQTKLNFFSVDEYYYHTIRQELNIPEKEKKIKHNSYKIFSKIDNNEKLKIGKLKLRKSYRGILNTPKSSNYMEKIKKLKEIQEESTKKEEIQLKSKMKTSIYRKFIETLNRKENNKHVPSQRLFFKPPLEFEGIVRLGYHNSQQVQEANEEIEIMMDDLAEEIKTYERKPCFRKRRNEKNHEAMDLAVSIHKEVKKSKSQNLLSTVFNLRRFHERITVKKPSTITRNSNVNLN